MSQAHDPIPRPKSSSAQSHRAKRFANSSRVSGTALLLTAGLAACGTDRLYSAGHPQPTRVISPISVQHTVRAKEDDVFFATYNDTTVFIHGLVSSISPSGGGATVILGTHGGRVLCALAEGTPSVRVGRAITLVVLDPQQDVSRSTHGLTISPCRLATNPHAMP